MFLAYTVVSKMCLTEVTKVAWHELNQCESFASGGTYIRNKMIEQFIIFSKSGGVLFNKIYSTINGRPVDILIQVFLDCIPLTLPTF